MDGRYIDIDGIKTFYIDRGAGPTVVLLHGATLTSDSRYTWFRTIPALARRYRVIAFDQIGMGRTDLAKDGRYKDRLERIDHAIKFLKALGVTAACLVGHSEGGFMAARITIVEPTLASRLVIVTSGATAPNLGGGRDAEWIKVNEARYNDPHRFDDIESYTRVNAGLSFVRDPEADAVARENFTYAKARGRDRVFADMPITDTDYVEREKFQQKYILSHLKRMTIPVLLVWTLNDRGVIVERGVKLLEYLPKGAMHVFASASHMVMHDRAEAFNNLLLGWCGA
jgi:pimeloyl-ACP methyl ester carboxylesterase